MTANRVKSSTEVKLVPASHCSNTCSAASKQHKSFGQCCSAYCLLMAVYMQNIHIDKCEMFSDSTRRDAWQGQKLERRHTLTNFTPLDIYCPTFETSLVITFNSKAWASHNFSVSAGSIELWLSGYCSSTTDNGWWRLVNTHPQTLSWFWSRFLTLVPHFWTGLHRQGAPRSLGVSSGRHPDRGAHGGAPERWVLFGHVAMNERIICPKKEYARAITHDPFGQNKDRRCEADHSEHLKNSTNHWCVCCVASQHTLYDNSHHLLWHEKDFPRLYQFQPLQHLPPFMTMMMMVQMCEHDTISLWLPSLYVLQRRRRRARASGLSPWRMSSTVLWNQSPTAWGGSQVGPAAGRSLNSVVYKNCTKHSANATLKGTVHPKMKIFLPLSSDQVTVSLCG